MTTLYIKDNSGKLRYWSCREVLDGIEIEHGVLGGTPQFQYEEILEGKATRDQDEQIESRIQSRVNKQLDKGYVYDIEVAKSSKPMNRLGFCKPMLAKNEHNVDLQLLRKHPIYIQNKLDGNRCLIHNDGVKLTAYTRNGKEFTTLDHITDALEGVIPEGCTLDGELYIHGTPLQTIVSYVKRKQVATKSIQYHVYDLISNDKFSKRIERLNAILTGVSNNHSYPIKLVETLQIEPDNPIDLGRLLKEARDLSYEGLMLRSDFKIVRGNISSTGYEDGKRSSSLVKIKAWESEEFDVINIVPSKDGWARLECLCGNSSFFVSCPGDMNFKYHVMNNKNEYIGKTVTCEFAYWTRDMLPFHPTAVAFRDYE